ncbi:HXXXD-type acyl-transferase family protein [Striga asiatica]|uniref:HXXXD-type acyl-transferase family protein n=1 Tax=Striga asiatica TaxID=4170 RepID=A0A5A7PIX3_STRAF|nr:HXXXD-type acyl-transferase family protein [Striga asiatica]
MPPTRNSKRQLLGEDNKAATVEKSLNLPKKSQKTNEGAVPLRKSRRLMKKELLPGRVRPSSAYYMSKLRESKCYVPKGKEIAETALCEYNKKHGTDLELLRVLDGKELCFFGPGFSHDFAEGHCYWFHLNIEARLCSSGPDNTKPLLLFVESKISPRTNLSTLSLVAPTDKFELQLLDLLSVDIYASSLLNSMVSGAANGCQKCWSFISHPRYGFRAGFDASTASDPKQLLEDDAVKLSQLALQDYNEQHGTNVKFEKAFGGNSFTGTGISMDFAEKSTRWVHVNFEARVGFGHREQLRRMFAELYYVENDDKYVIATLLPAEPEEKPDTIYPWTDGYPESECAICPGEIRHPWRAYRYGFNYPPSIIPREKYP